MARHKSRGRRKNPEGLKKSLPLTKCFQSKIGPGVALGAMEFLNRASSNSRCRIQKMINDKDFVQWREKLQRTPHYIRQQFEIGTGAITCDEGFDSLENEFKKVESSVAALVAYHDAFTEALSAFTEHAVKIRDLLELILDVNCSSASSMPLSSAKSATFKDPGSESRREQEWMSSVGLMTAAGSAAPAQPPRGPNLQSKIGEDIMFLEDRVRQPLAVIKDLCIRVRRTLRERQILVADLNFATNRFNRLETRAKLHDGADCKPRERLQARRDLELEKLRYESLNVMLKSELAVFLDAFKHLLRDWFSNFYYNVYTIYYNLHMFSTKNKATLQKPDGGLPSWHTIVEDFRARAELLGSPKVCLSLPTPDHQPSL
ncbi:LAMI_0H01090g1_1 [Lachancea mirantina]|uniref:LAMI_0H01090g1_1 n=1 Tax=Lachancea mirantina TaxID=1230905 RepID=A0A1G4KDT6_9SACH|nr:LAMI_0H01090g1_1 [Lachancea mirantina]